MIIKTWNIEYMTGLVMVLNWKIAEHYRKNDRLAEMYDELWNKADEWMYEHFDGDDLQYFMRTTDQDNIVFFFIEKIAKKCHENV